jgi:hypothetical protein
LKLLVLKHGIAVYQEAEEVAKQEKTILIAVLANMETTLNQVKADVKELGNTKTELGNMETRLKNDMRTIIRSDVASLVKTEVTNQLKNLEIIVNVKE